ELGLEPGRRSNQGDAEIKMPGGGKRAVHDVRRRLIAAHGVDGYPNHEGVWDLFFVDRPSLASAIVPAIGADAVRQLGFVALGTLAEAHRLQRVVRPALGRPRLRVSPFWIWHRGTLIAVSCES